MAFTYLKVKSEKCLCLLPVVLVLVLKQWSWSCYFGLSLVLKNMILSISLVESWKVFQKSNTRIKGSWHRSRDLHLSFVTHQWSCALQILYINKTCCLLSAADLKYVPKVGVASLIVYKIRHPSTSTKSTNSVTSHSVSIEPQQVLAHGRQRTHKWAWWGLLS